MQREQTTEVQVAAIHHVERSGLEGQHIQHVDLVGLAVRDMNEGWNVAAQIEQRMKFDCCLGGTKRRPWKQRQTQVDGRGIQGIHRIGKLYSKAVVAVEFASTSDEQRCQIRPDMPVATFVGIGQRRPFDGRAKTHAMQLRLVGKQASLYIAQTLAVGQLCEGHGTELLGTTQIAYSDVAAIARYDACKTGPRNELHDLCEQRLAQVHNSPPEVLTSGRYLNRNMDKQISNRHQNKTLCKPRQCSILAWEFVS